VVHKQQDLAFGGYDGTASTTATEEYNGATWISSPVSLTTTRNGLAGCGTQTSALGFGGDGATGFHISNRRMDRCSTNNSYNHSFLTLYLSI
jgi:hypothetical protein